MSFVVFAILLASGLAESEDMGFDIYDYAGDISQKILRLYYKKSNIWERQPTACYGVLVDWKIALFPCSCMSYSKQTNKAWHHSPPVIAQMIDLKTLEVGTMFEEYEARYGNDKVKVVKYVQNPVGSDVFNCKTDLLFDWTAVELERQINFSRLIWFPTANQTVMRNLTEKTILESVSGETCRLVYWDKDNVVDPKTGKAEKERHFIQTSPVYLVPWDKCNDTVCPTFEALMEYKVNVTNNTWTEKIPKKPSQVKQDPKICMNNVRPEYKRSCVGWKDGQTAICSLVPGTPVVCGGGRFSGGIIGTITNTTIFCPTADGLSDITPINLIAEALPLISRHLRIVNAPGYSEFFTVSPESPSQLWIQGKSQANDILPFPSPVIFIFGCVKIIFNFFY